MHAIEVWNVLIRVRGSHHRHRRHKRNIRLLFGAPLALRKPGPDPTGLLERQQMRRKLGNGDTCIRSKLCVEEAGEEAANDLGVGWQGVAVSSWLHGLSVAVAKPFLVFVRHFVQVEALGQLHQLTHSVDHVALEAHVFFRE